MIIDLYSKFAYNPYETYKTTDRPSDCQRNEAKPGQNGEIDESVRSDRPAPGALASEGQRASGSVGRSIGRSVGRSSVGRSVGRSVVGRSVVGRSVGQSSVGRSVGRRSVLVRSVVGMKNIQMS